MAIFPQELLGLTVTVKPLVRFHSTNKVKNKRERRRWIFKQSRKGAGLCDVSCGREIFENVLLKIIKLCLETPCLCPSEGHKYGGRELTKTYLIEFCYKKPVVIFWALINIYVSTYSHTMTVQIAKSQRISHFFNLLNGILGRNINIVSRKSLEIQPCFITRRKPLSNWKFVKSEWQNEIPLELINADG